MKKDKDIVKYSDVFVPGGFPTYTYNPRDERRLQNKLKSTENNLCKLMMVTGPTKSGKTVLVDKVFPREESIWIDGGSVSNEDMFWEQILEALDEYTETGVEENESTEVDGGGKVSASIPLIGSATMGGDVKASTGSIYRKRRAVSTKTKAIQILEEEKIPLIVDDFHYIDKQTQKQIVRALKAPIMRGVPVICIAIPNRKFDVIEVEREMTGRIDTIEMPTWSDSELQSIASKGFEALNVEIAPSIIQSLSEEAFGSPFLIQDFCKEICEAQGIQRRQTLPQVIPDSFDASHVFTDVAENSGRSMFKKIERGPRQRKDRKERKLKNGEIVDIYGVVMAGFKDLKPNTETIPFESLRAHIRNVIDDTLPQHGEISRVLEKIAEISYSDSSSTPVIDWQKEDDLITITDPFFSFFLRWNKDAR